MRQLLTLTLFMNVVACSTSAGDEGALPGATTGGASSDGGSAGAPPDSTTGGASGGGGHGGEPPVLGCSTIRTPAADWYVGPDGRSDAAGTRTDPLSLPHALSPEGPVRPGHRVEMLGGVYTGRFKSELDGTAEAKIVFAAEPGARVTLDLNVPGDPDKGFVIEGSWTEFHGLEITHSGTDREEKPGGVEIFGANTRLVNSVIHDTLQGIGFWSTAVDATVYGNVIYNNGVEGPMRGHGHAIYTQNAQGTKHIANNIIFFGFGYGIHVYTETGSIQGFDISRNVWFRTGASRPGESSVGTSEGCLVGGLQPVDRVRLIGNHSWGPEPSARNLTLGWGGEVQNRTVTLIDNYFIGRAGAQGLWESGTFEGNVFHGELSGIDPNDYPDNTWSSSLPTDERVVLQRNDDDPGRVDIIAYNWSLADHVEVDLEGLLPDGAPYEVFSVYDLWGAPVVSGTYAGMPFALPMGSKPPPQPLGAPDAIQGVDDPGKAFGVFILRTPCAL